MKSLLISFPLGHMANDWAPGSIWLLAPAIAVSLGLSPSELGLLLTIHYMGAAVGYFPAGILSDRVGRQGKLLAATFWWVAIGYALASLAPGFWTLAVLLAIAGMGDAAWHPIATGVLVEQMPKRRGMVLGIHAMGGTWSEVGAPLAVGFLLTVFDWRTALQISTIPAVLMGIYFLYYARHIPESAEKAISGFELKALGRQWLRQRGMLLIGMIATYNMALMALMSMTPLYLQQVQGYTPAAAGIAFAASMLLGSLLQPVLGRYSDTVERSLIFIAGSIVAVLFSTIAFVTNLHALTVVSLILAMAVLVSIRSGILASAVDYAGTRAATTLGFIFMILDGVGALGALFAGFVAEIDLVWVFALSAILSISSIFLAVILRISAGKEA